MNERDIEAFWNAHPCNDAQIRSLVGDVTPEHEAFFAQTDAHRYHKGKEGHILACLDAIDFRGKRVLEIGLGQGADSEQIIRRGGNWSGIDLTAESVHRVRTRLQLRGLPFERLEKASALALPFADSSFDVVFSHGVLHHIPEIRTAQHEIARVLRPTGELITMLYARYSFEYLVQIGIIARLALAVRYLSGRRHSGEVAQHITNAQRLGLAQYLRMENFIHHSTDGALNPYTKVYDRRIVREDFPDFHVVRQYRRYMSPRRRYRLPVFNWLRLDRAVGWHMWVHMKHRRD